MQSSGRRYALFAVTLGLALLAPRPTTAQMGGGEFVPYCLRNTRAVDAEQALLRLLPQGVDVVADSRANRVLVRGPQPIQQMAARALESLDQPTTNAAPPAQPPRSEPVLRAYAVRSGDPMAIAQWLRNEVAMTPEVRIAADHRTNQVLVLAPAELQIPIAQRLAQAPQQAAAAQALAQPAAQAVAGNPPTVERADAVGTGTYVDLRNATPDDIAAGLTRMLGERCKPINNVPAGWSRYAINAATGGTVTVSVEQETRRVQIEGARTGVEATARLVQALDAGNVPGEPSTRTMPLKTSRPADIHRLVQAIQTGNLQIRPASDTETSSGAGPQRPSASLAMMFQKGNPSVPQAPAPGGAASAGRGANDPNGPAGVLGQVQVEIIEGLDIVVIRGNPRDVEQVQQIIQQIEKLSSETEPAIETYSLQHVDGEAVGFLVSQLYSEVFSSRQGGVTIVPLVKPNALLVVGRPENVKTVLDLVKRLDQPVAPETQFRVYALKYATAAAVQMTVQEFFMNRGGLGTKARVTSDIRTNSLIVQAAQRDLDEVAELISRIDTSTSQAVNELKVFPLQNSVASELAVILQGAISGQMSAAGRTSTGVAGGLGATAAASMARPGADQKTTMLRFMTIDSRGQRILNSGILTDVRITADTRSNALLVSAPADSMELLAALVHELDGHPSTTAQVKVFTIVNGDAAALVTVLQGMYAQTVVPGQTAMGTSMGDSESSLIPVRFGVDVRTNSIIASGSPSDLTVVEALLLRLDEGDAQRRKSVIYRLKNSPAMDVSNAINQFLTTERQIQAQDVRGLTTFEQIEREVVVVPEPVSNSLIVSATARFYEEIKALVEQLDKRPPMVMIQVLIAQVSLSNFNEFGIEAGLQDSLLFDRSILGNISTLTNTTQTTTQNGSGANVTTTATNQNIVSATNTPGFNFNNGQDLGNSGATNSLNGANSVGSQGLTNFGLGRTNSQLGYGGFVFSASSENVNLLLRALQQCQRLEVLSRPQIMTLDNQAAFVQVGERVPQITSVNQTTIGQTNAITLQNVGLILRVVPRISPDGLVVMEIDAEKSELGPDSEGVPISILNNGQVIRSPRIETTIAQTTVSALSGQTVVLGGLITKSKQEIKRRVPYLSDVPILGYLFRYDSTDVERTELLVVMTPHIVENEEDVDKIKQVECARMSWCLADVTRVHGDLKIRKRSDEWSDGETRVIYPDRDPSATSAPQPAAPEPVPLPAGKTAPEAAPRTLTPGSGPRMERTPPLPNPPGAAPATTPAPANSQLRWPNPADNAQYQSAPPAGGPPPGMVQGHPYASPQMMPPAQPWTPGAVVPAAAVEPSAPGPQGVVPTGYQYPQGP